MKGFNENRKIITLLKSSALSRNKTYSGSGVAAAAASAADGEMYLRVR